MEEMGFGPAYFAIISGSLLNCQTIPATAKLLYASITTLTFGKGYCWASNQYLAQRFQWSERTVSRLIAQLQEAGFLKIVMVKDQETGQTERRIYTDLSVAWAINQVGEAGWTKLSGGVDKTGEGGRQNCLGGVDKIVYQNNKRRINNTPVVPKEVVEAIRTFAGEDEELYAAIHDFVENRAAPPNPKPVKTAQGMKRLLNDLVKKSNGRRDVQLLMIDKAIRQNWQGFWELNEDEMPKEKVTEQEEGYYGWQ